MSKPLIENIEINYFRSIHRGGLWHCSPLNLIVGGNDSGKSNVLRALNLFFKNQTDLGTPYNFGRDLSLMRVKETKKGKTRAFLYVKITFNNILGYTSLPAQFTVKKQWNRYFSDPDLILPKESSGKKIPQNTIVRFLNQIEFHYVPAIKSREIFRYYLEQLYDVLAKRNLDLSGASDQLTDVINDATKEMAERIQKGIGISSRISMPKDFRALFGNLDFMTKFGGDDEVSLQQRGDGVQVAHIPYILDFIGRERGDKASIWVYEEPENSTEMTKAFELAERFAKDFSKRSQIFLTTHSPAFYGLTGEEVGKWRVKKLVRTIDGSEFEESQVEPLEDLTDVDNQLGITALVAEKAREVFEDHKNLQKELDQIKGASKPLVLCEGKTDVAYIQKALELYGKSAILSKCNIRQVGVDSKNNGCDALKKVKQDRQDRPYLYHTKAILVFDCDVTKVKSGVIDDKTWVYKFPQQNRHPFDRGIENALSKEAAGEISGDKFYIQRINEGSPFKKVIVQEFDKTKACKHICERSDINDFSHFSDLVNQIEAMIVA
jgi:predicted ATPase